MVVVSLHPLTKLVTLKSILVISLRITWLKSSLFPVTADPGASAPSIKKVCVTPAAGRPSIVGNDPGHKIPLDIPGAIKVGTGSELTITVSGFDVIEHDPLVTITLTSCPLVKVFIRVLEALAAP